VVVHKIWICTHTHTHLTAFCPGLPGWAGTNLDCTEARDIEWQWHQLDHMQVCTSLQIDNYASTPPLSFFYRLDARRDAQPTVLKHWRQLKYEYLIWDKILVINFQPLETNFTKSWCKFFWLTVHKWWWMMMTLLLQNLMIMAGNSIPVVGATASTESLVDWLCNGISSS